MSPDESVLTWRISELERQVDQLRHDMSTQLDQQNTMNAAARTQIRADLATKYLTADQTALTYLSRKDLRQSTKDHRDYILYLIAVGQLVTAILLVVLH